MNGVMTIIKEIKSIHPDYVALIRTGTFYCVYGKDASILSNLFEYQFKEVSKNEFNVLNYIKK